MFSGLTSEKYYNNIIYVRVCDETTPKNVFYLNDTFHTNPVLVRITNYNNNNGNHARRNDGENDGELYEKH